jgi:hypothetical protein
MNVGGALASSEDMSEGEWAVIVMWFEIPEGS